MTEALPEGMRARLERLGTELAGWARQHREAPLAEAEQAVLSVVRAALPGLLEAVLDETTPSLRSPNQRVHRACPLCGNSCREQDWRTRTVRTVCGPVTVERPWYHCTVCKQGWSPADQELAVGKGARLSPGLAAWITELGAAHVFAEGAWWLERLTGLTVASETIRQHTEATGAALETAQQAAITTVQQTQEAAEPVDPAPGTLVVEADGVMVRYRETGWHEVKLGLVGGHVEGATSAQSSVAARASAEDFGPRLLAEAARRGALEVVGWQGPVTGRGLAVLRRVVVLGDGAHWIWNLAADHFGERVEIVDFYHATEHIWAVAKALFGEDHPVTPRWAHFAITALHDAGAEALLTSLAAVKPPTPTAAEVLRVERAYFRTNAARMAYPDFRQQGLPIGSGAVESAAKHVVQLRMKRSGARWSKEGAQAVLNVRCHLRSHRSLAA